MSLYGLFAMLLAFAAIVVSVVTLIAGHALRQRKADLASTLSWAGRLACVIACIALAFACGVLIAAFISGNMSIQYVLDNHVSTTGTLGLLYRISGLWAGRAGSLLFWAFLISLFAAIVSLRRMGKTEPLDNMAVLIMELVLAAFVGIMLFSESNMPFTVTDSVYYDDDGYLTDAASLLGMNKLLQHWAMAIHPPMLFLGYAGLTVPFAYAIATCICNDAGKQWVLRSERYALAAWLFLTIGRPGQCLGHVCLGWGGYWGWDPVENASLLSWLVAVALIHSFTQYKTRGMFKRWAVMCACLAFCFCIVGTFISRSGLVQSVHAFEGDPVSLVLFGVLIVVSILLGVAGCIWRRKSFATEQTDDMESMFSKYGAFFINNLVMVVMAVLLAYLTIAQALPSWLPFGGESVSSGTYEAIARPLGVLYLLMMAVCPLLGWCKTDAKAFFKKALVPGICAVVLFALLALYWATVLLPTYDTVTAAGGTAAEVMTEQGPAAYYNGLALAAFFVASLLIFNSGYQFVRVIRSLNRKTAAKGLVVRLGSCVSHLAMGVLLIGLVGSSMYITEVSAYLPYDEETGLCTETFEIGDYELEFVEGDAQMGDDYASVEYTIKLDVNRDGIKIGEVEPGITLVMATQQQQYNAGVMGMLGEDLFVVYQGVSSEDSSIHLDVRINPLISVVWLGFILLCIGMFMSLLGRRKTPAAQEAGTPAAAAPAIATAEAEAAPEALDVSTLSAEQRAQLLKELQAADANEPEGTEGE